MFSERVGPLELLARPEGRVALAGTLLAFLQAGGLVLSLYLLVTNYLEREPRSDPSTHICTEALACLLFRYGPLHHQTGRTHTALAGQMLYRCCSAFEEIKSCFGKISFAVWWP
jgi:hypothetical protein